MEDWAGRDIAHKLDAFLQALHDDLKEDDASFYGSLNGKNFLARSERLFPHLDRAAAWTVLQKGVALHKLAVAQAAIAAGRRLIDVAADDGDDGLARETALPGDPAELRALAAACYRTALALDPASAAAQFNLARLAEEAGDPGDALARYEAAAADPWYRPHALMRMGLMFSAAGDVPAALRCLREAVTLLPSFGRLHVRIADAFRQAGCIDEALAEYAKTVESSHYIPPEFVLRPPPPLPADLSSE